ncbi:MAG: phosphate regulon sensor histidine kinase PhoR [Gammaproteobacteria bacterium]|nr:phosphate regulon sensor histidine kinase PhoR [Gammaproteobacteria bacterium]
MKTVWGLELSRILGVIASVVLIGLLTKNWMVALIFPLSLYIGWTLRQLWLLERWIRLGAKPDHAPNASGIWQLMVQHINRTQKKNKERKTRLREMADRFGATITALPDAAIVLNEDLEIEWVNEVAKRILGLEIEKNFGQKFDQLIANPELKTIFEQQSESEENDPTSIEMESPIDPQKTLLMTSVEFGNKQKLVIARDISQRVAVQKLRKAFIANASHELRTPLTVISGYLEMLETDESIPESAIELIHRAGQQSNRMQKILEDLLVLSKLEEKGHDRDSGEPLNIADLLQKLITDFQKTKAKDTHNIVLTANESLMIKANEREVFSLCQNLLSNAVKYSKIGSEIIVCWDKHADGSACISVADSGEGIAPEHISRLTERFYRANVNHSRKVGGTGLGLSIVKHIVENHGGHLDIHSELGIGSTFRACFPVYRIVKA